MKAKSTQRSEGRDPVISAVLEAIFKVAQLDPAHLAPDERLMKDAGFSGAQVAEVVALAAKSLGLNVPPPLMGARDTTAREVAHHLRAVLTETSRRSA